MTSHRFHLALDGSQGALLRVLGTVERRGWQLRAVATERAGEHGMAVTLEAAPLAWHGASCDVLRRHLAKLICVKTVTFAAAGPPPAASEVPPENLSATVGAVS